MVFFKEKNPPFEVLILQIERQFLCSVGGVYLYPRDVPSFSLNIFHCFLLEIIIVSVATIN